MHESTYGVRSLNWCKPVMFPSKINKSAAIRSRVGGDIVHHPCEWGRGGGGATQQPNPYSYDVLIIINL